MHVSNIIQISTPLAPKAIGPYSQAVMCGGFLFISGIIPINPQTGELLKDTIESETALVLDNLKAIVEAAGMTLGHVLKTTVYLRDLGLFGRFNEVYGRYFSDRPPARETMQVSGLPKDASIEISAICGK